MAFSIAWVLSLPPVHVVPYVDQPCAVLVRLSCVLPVEGCVLQAPGRVLPLPCTFAYFGGASPLPSLHVDISHNDGFLLGAHSSSRSYGMGVAYHHLSRSSEADFLSGKLCRAFRLYLCTRCHSDHFASVSLASMDCRNTLSLLNIRLIRGLLFKHDYLALIRGWLLRNNCPALAPRILSDYFCFSGKILVDVVRTSYFHCCWYYFSIKSALCKESVIDGKPLAPPKLEPTHPGSLQGMQASSSERYRGRGRKVSSFSFEHIKDHIVVQEKCDMDRYASKRYKFVDYVDDAGLCKYPPENYVHTTLPLSWLLGLLTKTQAQVVAAVHNLQPSTSARTSSAAPANMAKNHYCPQCVTCKSVFSMEPSKREVSNARLQAHHRNK